jgi:choline kinase
MRAIIIGAGRGKRLMPTTADAPKCFAEVAGKRLLDWALHSFRANGIERIAFIGGYQIEKVQQDYPQFTFRHNRDWESNNILLSLLHAEDLMDEDFICCYSDILFTPRAIGLLLQRMEDMSLVVDTHWTSRYGERTEHPPEDAEKVIVRNGLVARIDRAIPTEEAHGEYIGVAKFSPPGAKRLRAHFHRCRQLYAGRPFREAKVFEKAYLIQLFQEMIEQGEQFAHVDIPGGYIEVDTQQDFDYARRHWLNEVREGGT